MKLLKDVWAAVVAITDIVTVNPLQHPLQDDSVLRSFGRPARVPVFSKPTTHEQPTTQDSPHAQSDCVVNAIVHKDVGHDYLSFVPPFLEDPDADPFRCQYKLNKDEWEPCSSPNDRACWLKNRNGSRYEVCTDYEKQKPPGVLREYHLVVNRAVLDQDGTPFEHGLTFGVKRNESNQTEPCYPGPWIRACWGDTIRVHVTNNITKYNGTTVHWHGIRQLHTSQADGVNGVTQCPIAPNETFTYEFQTWQYGTSWYHSHYSIQYADGLVGPMTIYGPSSANWDKSLFPTMMTDWNHRSAFEDFSYFQYTQEGGNMDSILLNGIGNFAGMAGNKRYTLVFQPGKRYLLRLINTAATTAFVFAIDGHEMEVISSDFVPIKPYKTDNVLIGIGQRYHVVVQAKSQAQLDLDEQNGKTLDHQNYWIRTVPADGCSEHVKGNEPDERQGVLRYSAGSKIIPTTDRSFNDTSCRDEHPENLVPVLGWQIGKPSNKWATEDRLGVAIHKPNLEDPFMYGTFPRWGIGKKPLWLDFSNPSIVQLNDNQTNWDSKAVIIPANYTADDWVWLFISGTAHSPEDRDNWKIDFEPAAHPIHLHGHDFAILAQSDKHLGDITNETNLLELLKPTLDNPPRRDTALLPANGSLLIAFKADNPGIWIMHCHIGFHASSGLALQILEREPDIIKSHHGEDPEWLKRVQEGCQTWKEWFSKDENLWNGDRLHFQDDSGI